MIRFQVMGETPSKKNVNKFNSKIKRVYKDAHFMKWHDDALIQLNAQICRSEPMPNLIDYPVTIYIDFYHGDYVRRDSDNQVSSLMDLLQDAKILSDDNWQIVRQIHVRNYYEKREARCLIEIEEYHD